MSVVAEYLWLTDPAGAVRVKYGKSDVLVVESDWVRVSGDAAEGTDPIGSAVSFETSATPGVWTSVLVAETRREAVVCNTHSDPSAIVLVRGGPYGPKPIWPDGPPFVTNWRGTIQVMSPTHASVRCSGSQF